jgi:hypothetical protein
MVNFEKRSFAGELIVKYLSLEITSDELNDDFPDDERDPALEAIWSNLWRYYSDTSHKAEGKHELSPEAKDLFERCAAFLRTDLDYEWPPTEWISFKYSLWRFLGLGKQIERVMKEFESHGDFEVWPFIRREDYIKVRFHNVTDSF